MAQINGVTVRVSDGIKTADYAPPRLYDLTANVTFQVDDDVDAVLASTVARLRSAGEHFLSGRCSPAPASKPAKPAPAPAPEPPKAEEPKPEPAPPSNDVSDLLGDPAPKAPPPPAEITNNEITHKVMQKNDQLKDATKIRALVETYNPQPGLRVFKATEIEQKDRAGFLEKLATL